MISCDFNTKKICMSGKPMTLVTEMSIIAESLMNQAKEKYGEEHADMIRELLLANIIEAVYFPNFEDSANNKRQKFIVDAMDLLDKNIKKVIKEGVIDGRSSNE